jgi:hypothetical protein
VARRVFLHKDLSAAECPASGQSKGGGDAVGDDKAQYAPRQPRKRARLTYSCCSFGKYPYGRPRGGSGRIVKVFGSCKSLVRLTSSRERMRRNKGWPGGEGYTRSQAGSASSKDPHRMHVTKFGGKKLWLLLNNYIQANSWTLFAKCSWWDILRPRDRRLSLSRPPR